MPTILIKNADWLVTMDAERRIITDGALLIENDRVVKIGKTSALKRTRADTVTEAVGNAEKAFKALRGMHDGRVRPWFALRVLAVCSDDLIRAIKAKADEHGVGLVLHASEARDEVVASRVKFGMPDVERMAALGVLGPNVLLIHMGWASPKELVLCMRHDLKVSCTPSTGYRLGLGSIEFGRFPEMLELGVTVALGSDSAMSSNYLDIVREMFLVSGGCKAQRLDPTVLPPETALEMATVNGAKAVLWSEEIGALEVGKKADVAIFDTQSPEWQPVINPIANLVYAARGGADTVICDGRVLMRDKIVLSIDEKQALKEAKQRGARIAERAGLRDRVRPAWPIV